MTSAGVVLNLFHGILASLTSSGRPRSKTVSKLVGCPMFRIVAKPDTVIDIDVAGDPNERHATPASGNAILPGLENVVPQ